MRFEPKSALVAAENGFQDIRHISTHAPHFARFWLALFEHGYDQGVAVRTIMRDLGYQNIITEQDYAGHDRVTLGQYKTEREA